MSQSKGKDLFIAEKPSVAREFAKALKYRMTNRDGYMESEEAVVTWCVGHLVTMSYPEAYDPALKRWSLQTLPFLPEEYKYEVIPGVQKQFDIVSSLLNREDVTTIYVCTDSGREGEYIYRLVEKQAGVHGKKRRRVWIDSQTEEEILRGIREAKDLSAYDQFKRRRLSAGEGRLPDGNQLLPRPHAEIRHAGEKLSEAGPGRHFRGPGHDLRAWHGGEPGAGDPPVRQNPLLPGDGIPRPGRAAFRQRADFAGVQPSVGAQPFAGVRPSVGAQLPVGAQSSAGVQPSVGVQSSAGVQPSADAPQAFEGEWRAVEGSAWYQSPLLYKENGFLKKESAEALIDFLKTEEEAPAVEKIERKKEQKYPPLLYTIWRSCRTTAPVCSSSVPDETLRIAQELYEKKLTTYPRTDARVLSTAVAKEIAKEHRRTEKLSACWPPSRFAGPGDPEALRASPKPAM